MAGKVNIFLRQLISFASMELHITMSVIQPSAKSTHSSEPKIFPFVVLVSKSSFAAAIS